MLRPLLAALVLLAATPAAAQPPPTWPKDGDKDGDGRLTREEYRAVAWGRLAGLDKNRDGAVAKTELPGLARLPGVQGRLDAFWKTMDASGDGAVSREEIAGLSDRRFAQFDTDMDGFLTRAEIEAARKAAGAR